MRALSSGHASKSAPGTPPPAKGRATNGSLFTRRAMLRRMTALGHEERFPPTKLSADYGFSKETFEGGRRNGRDAPIPDLPALAPNEEVRSYSRPFAATAGSALNSRECESARRRALHVLGGERFLR